MSRPSFWVRHDRSVVGAIVLVSFIATILWALTFPIMLAPDEDNHYDYAVTVFTLRRGMVPSENRVGRDTHPVVKYLLAATRARILKVDPYVRLGPHELTLAHIRDIDRRAPITTRENLLADPGLKIPYVSRAYPIGYYALAAAAIAIASFLTGGSAVWEFLAVRILSATFLVPTLIFTWLALRELKVGSIRSLVLLALIAFFPVTIWTFGSVQPDTLAAPLCAISTWVALRLRKRILDRKLYALLCVSLALLAIVKPHYLVAEIIPIFALIVTRLPLMKRPLTSVALLTALFAFPAASFASVYDTLRVQSAATGFCDTTRMIGSAKTLSEASSFVYDGIAAVVQDGFRGGIGLNSFWLTYTAYRNRTLIVGNESLTAGLLVLIPIATSILAVASLWLLLRNAFRIFVISRRRSLLTAFKIMTSNVVINSYLAFLVIFTGVEIYVDGYMPVQGRYFLPYLGSIWLLALVRAPRVLGRRPGEAVTKRLLVLLGLFTCTAFVSQFPTLWNEFYKPATASPRAGDERNVEIHAEVGNNSIRISGFAIDLSEAAPLRNISVVLDGRRIVPISFIDRPEMLCFYEESLLHSGFAGDVTRKSISPGKHIIRMVVGNPSNVSAAPGIASATFFVK